MKFSTETAYDCGDFVPTYTGRAVCPSNLKLTDVSIIDVAHGLSNKGRFGGATDSLYSVAQHCCVLANYVETRLKGSPLDCLQILMHDAHEYVLGDLVRPIKKHLLEYRAWEHDAAMIIRAWLGLGDVMIPPWLDELDSRVIVDEMSQLLCEGQVEIPVLQPLGIRIEPWTPRVAEQQFLVRYATYMQRVHGSHQYLRSKWGVPTQARFKSFPFQTMGGDVLQRGEVDAALSTSDLIEVDLRGNVGRVTLRSPNGMMMRDTSAGSFPRPAWKWLHGKFELTTGGVQGVQLNIDGGTP